MVTITLTRKKIALATAVLCFLVLTLVAVQAFWRPFGAGAPLTLRSHKAGFDIRNPDAIIDSAALSRLPADMIRLPFLRALLTRDFVDYYETDSTRLALAGTVRRLAFEHDLDWKDDLVRRVFDEPSRVLLWRSPDGRLGYWVMAVQRNFLAKLVQAVGNVVADDRQLGKAATLPGGTPVYALRLAVGRTLLFAAKGDQLLIISEPGLLLDEDGALADQDRAKAFERMLDDGGDEALKAYGLGRSEKMYDHRLAVSVNYLSFGYQTFFPGIHALRFEFTSRDRADAADADSGWSTAALINPARLPQGWDTADIWRALPANAAACASLPVNWNEAAGLLDTLGLAGDLAATAFREQEASPVGVCWYAQSTLAAPVFITRLDPRIVRDPARLGAVKDALGIVFDDAIGAYEAKADGTPGDDAKASDYRRLPVEKHEISDAVTLWTRPVSAARSGTERSAASRYASRLSASRYFPVTLALAHGYLVFSPDARLVENTLAVLDKRYPAIADTLAPQSLAATVALVTPAAAAKLVEREVGRALPRDQEAIFRNAARTHLLPKLQAAAAYPPFAMRLPALPAATEWTPVEWSFETPPDTSASPGSGDTGLLDYTRPDASGGATGG